MLAWPISLLCVLLHVVSGLRSVAATVEKILYLQAVHYRNSMDSFCWQIVISFRLFLEFIAFRLGLSRVFCDEWSQCQPFSLCSMWWMQAVRVVMNLSLHDHVKQRWSSCIDCRLSITYKSCVCSCITSTSDNHHNTCQTVYPQFLQPV